MQKKIILLISILIIVIGISFLLNSQKNKNLSANVNSSNRPVWSDVNTATKNGYVSSPNQILELQFKYDENSDISLIDLVDAKIKSGHAPKYEIHEDQEYYILKMLDNKESLLGEFPFVIPNRFDDPPPLPGESARLPSENILSNVDFTITILWDNKIAKIQISDSYGNEIIKKDLGSVQLEQNTIKFKSIKGSDVLHNIKPNLFNFLDFFRKAFATTNILDITFIGEDFSSNELAIFQSDVDLFINHLLTYEPFKSRASQIVFHYVDNTNDLGCVYNGRLLTCNTTLVYSQLNTAGVPYDKAVVIVNNSTYGGAGGSLTVAYNGSKGKEVFVHELGHALGDVRDEYNLYSTNGSINNTVTPNCYSGTPPAASWSSLVGLSDYTLGCTYPNWYRSAPDSIMLALSYPYFNAVSQQNINSKIDYFTGSFSNSISPQSLITSPSNNSVVSGNVTINANLSDDLGIARAELWKDGTLYKTDYSSPWSFVWPSTQDSNNAHTLQVKAFDTPGNIGNSQIITVNVNNSTDAIPPTVSISTPANNTTVSEVTVLSVNTSDNVGVAGVQYKLNGNNLDSEVISSPFSKSWATSSVSNGVYTLTAIARDFSGNTTTSSPVNITISNISSSPVVSITSPTGNTISGKSVKFTATTNVTSTVTLSINDVINKNCSNVISCSYTWNLKNVVSGTYTLKAVATNTSGTTTVTKIVTK